MPWFIPLLISIAVSAVSYMLMPKPKQARPEAMRELEEPVAEAGKPLGVLFGTKTIKELNVLWYGDKSTKTYKVKA